MANKQKKIKGEEVKLSNCAKGEEVRLSKGEELKLSKGEELIMLKGANGEEVEAFKCVKNGKIKLPKKTNRTNIGGQAVLEGVMMRGSCSMATAVRDDNGKITVESKRFKANAEKSVIYRIPFIRGIFNFLNTMVMGVGILTRSAEVFDGEAEPSKFEKWFAKTFKVDALSVAMVFAVIIGLAMSVGLFFVLPQVILGLIEKYTAINLPNIVMNLIDGLIRIVIFVGYILLVSLMKEIKRTFMYHGAEHKTISAYEHGLDLTVENVQKMTTVHDRCGTTFMFIIMVISILVFSLTGWGSNRWLRLLIRLALLPVIAGVSYEILKFLAKFDNWFVKILKAPGLLLQKLTTKQPTDEMVEVAIVAFKTVLAMEADLTIAQTDFDTKMLATQVRASIEKELAKVQHEPCETDWIMCEVLGVKRDAIAEVTHIRKSKADKMLAFAKERGTGKPLQQVFGYTEFYGYKIKVNKDVLCPRPETEYLVEQVKKLAFDGCNILDMCAGSGAIAIATVKELEKENISCQMVASDISASAIDMAKENAKINSCYAEIEADNAQASKVATAEVATAKLAKESISEKVAKESVAELDKTKEVENKKAGAGIKFVLGNLFENIEGEFDIIVSNPPYIKTNDIQTLQNEVKNYEPICALDGGADGLDFYKKIINDATKFLKVGGNILFECGLGQAQEIKEMLNKDYIDIKIVKDLENIDRIIIAKRK
ncbi:MAG: peptide chain release factor N(5)-glutamine methyltransferase [Clostridia bacterium]